MRLLNVYTLQFKEFEKGSIPSYAIGSHRWTEDETRHVDVLERRNMKSEGHKKVHRFYDFVKSKNERLCKGNLASRLDWIWLDTCCIDRRSSAEISENVNSMYKYYEQCEECYAYLSDVTSTTKGVASAEFQNSVWFTRGWTLQELLAPARVFFVSSDWKLLGHKCPAKCSNPWRSRPICCTWGEAALNDTIADITGICVQILNKRRDPRKAPSDQVCRWIERRKTKREEDLAYCLLGLLGVFMIPNYGEGDNAWSRLEEEVSKKRTPEYWLPRPIQLLSGASLLDDLDFSDSPTHLQQLLDRGRLSCSIRRRILLLSEPLDDKLWRHPRQGLVLVRTCRECQTDQDRKHDEPNRYEQRPNVEWEEEQAECNRVRRMRLDMALHSHSRGLEEEREMRRRQLEEYMEPKIARRHDTEPGVLRGPQSQEDGRMFGLRTLSAGDQTTTTKVALLKDMVGQALSTFSFGLPQGFGCFGDPLSPVLLDDDYRNELF